METGVVNIRGKEYRTVALRVTEFREQCPAKDGWAILTEIVERTDEFVVVKAIIAHDQLVVATGFAEEQRSASQINRTSALENCETSAIGRALAAFGLGGSEYASANEVANAIHQQTTPQVRGRMNRKPPAPPALTKEEQEYVTDTLKVISVADNEDLDNIANDIKDKSPAVRDAIITAGNARRQFLKENPDAQDQQTVAR